MSSLEHKTSAQLLAPQPSQFSDTQVLLAGCLEGNETNFAQIWERFLPGLKVLVAGKIRSNLDPRLRSHLDAEAEDILQQVMIKASGNLASFDYRGPGSVLAWLTQITNHEYLHRLDYWNAARRAAGRETPEKPQDSQADCGPQMAALGPGPVTIFDISEKRKKIARALATLDDRYHQILYFRFFGGASWSEIAEELNAPSADAVRMECHGKALPALAVALAKA